ncbi:MAG: DUF397 domain-containing protein [Streptosporangiaceae bacterium]
MRFPEDDLSCAQWRKSTHSSGGGNDCVEVAPVSGVIAVRDSKHPTGGALGFTRTEFRALTTHIRNRS